MQIAIASGKGGTGKTMLSTSLAVVAADSEKTTVLDCDVEEPNAGIFLKPERRKNETVFMQVPEVDRDKCTRCGRCEKICRFNAIILIADTIMVSPDLCHGCGGCKLVCPTKAIKERQQEIGKVTKGHCNGVLFFQGMLNIGCPMSPPVIKAVKAHAQTEGVTIIDAPPGTSCPVVEAVKDVDYVLLVTESTPFGLNDLKLAVEMLKRLNKKFGIIINKKNSAFDDVNQYCETEKLCIVAEMNNDRRIAEHYSRNEIIADVLPEYRTVFEKILTVVKNEVKKDLKDEGEKDECPVYF